MDIKWTRFRWTVLYLELEADHSSSFEISYHRLGCSYVHHVYVYYLFPILDEIPPNTEPEHYREHGNLRLNMN